MSKKKSIVSVQVRKGDIQKALKIFKRRVSESGHLFEVRKRQEFTKPTTIRRKQKQQAIRENQRQVILDKIEDGNTTLRLQTKKRKKGKRQRFLLYHNTYIHNTPSSSVFFQLVNEYSSLYVVTKQTT